MQDARYDLSVYWRLDGLNTARYVFPLNVEKLFKIFRLCAALQWRFCAVKYAILIEISQFCTWAAVQFLFLLAAATVVVGLAGGVVAGLVLGARLVRVTAQAVVQLKQRRQLITVSARDPQGTYPA
mgnify:CR=1 FL=1